MKNRIILIILVFILLAGLGYLYSQKTQEFSEDSSNALQLEESKVTEQKKYTTVKYPNGPTFEYRSDLYFDNLYKENKEFVFRSSSEGYASVSTIENYSQSLLSKTGTGKISDEDGSTEYLGTKNFGKNILVEFEACGLDTCQNIFILKGPKDQALIIEGNINFINPDSIIFSQ